MPIYLIASSRLDERRVENAFGDDERVRVKRGTYLVRSTLQTTTAVGEQAGFNEEPKHGIVTRIEDIEGTGQLEVERRYAFWRAAEQDAERSTSR